MNAAVTAEELRAAEVRLPLLSIEQLRRERDVAPDGSALLDLILGEMERRDADDQ